MKNRERLNFFKTVNWKQHQFGLRIKDFVTFVRRTHSGGKTNLIYERTLDNRFARVIQHIHDFRVVRTPQIQGNEMVRKPWIYCHCTD